MDKTSTNISAANINNNLTTLKDEKNELKLKVNNNYQSLESMIDMFGPNYNYDEGYMDDDSYYQPLKNQLKTMNFSLFSKIINSQLDINK